MYPLDHILRRHQGKAGKLPPKPVSSRFPQELNETVGGKLEEYIHAINGCYPPEIVEYYSPNYSKILLDKIDEFQPIVA